MMKARQLLALLLICAALPAWAQSSATEYAVKGALLFKLPLFVYRPDSARDPAIEICVLGTNPFAHALEKMAQTPIDGKPVKVIYPGSPGDIGKCDVLFIARSEAPRLDSILRRLERHPALTVSDIEGFSKAGGMVELALGGEGSAISILINRKAGQRQNIEFNAQLLRLAKTVEP